jgi:hypothetical protein
MSRTRQLGYNRKVDQYRRTQVHLRAIEEWIAARGDDEKQRQLVSLDLEVVVVKPRWLCKTFAFHPMLGFRRDRQAQSIAHGCASTLIELTNRYRAMPEAVASWQVDTARLPEHTSLSSALEHQSASKSRDHEAGGCWLRPGLTCPYSEVATRRLGLPRATVRELARIHAFCRRPETHAVEQK